jgi:hypothetical protein
MHTIAEILKRKKQKQKQKKRAPYLQLHICRNMELQHSRPCCTPLAALHILKGLEIIAAPIFAISPTQMKGNTKNNVFIYFATEKRFKKDKSEEDDENEVFFFFFPFSLLFPALTNLF